MDELLARAAAANYLCYIRQARASVGLTQVHPYKDWWVSFFSSIDDTVRHGYGDTVLEAMLAAFDAEPHTPEFQELAPPDRPSLASVLNLASKAAPFVRRV